jgi:hypothetical protein
LEVKGNSGESQAMQVQYSRNIPEGEVIMQQMDQINNLEVIPMLTKHEPSAHSQVAGQH